MGYSTKIQRIKRAKSEQWYIFAIVGVHQQCGLLKALISNN